MTDRWGGVGRGQYAGQHLLVDRIGPEPADITPGGQEPVKGGPILGWKRPAPDVRGPFRGAGAIADGWNGTGPSPAA